MHYHLAQDGLAICELCPQGCQIAPGKVGFCKVRLHEPEGLVALNYGCVASIALDPIEKKPLYHYFPGKPILSVGSIGCNLGCEFCQNWQISRESAATQPLTPEELVDLAIQAHEESGSIGLAYTYAEPGVWFEFLMSTMPRLRETGLKNVLVTNAFLQPGPWRQLLEYTDAANIDLKGFEADYYRRLCHGRLQPVLDNIQAAVGKIHLELTTLIIPGENDQPEQIRDLAKWVAALDPELPLHLSRYFPSYKMTKPPTPLETMEQAYRIAREYLQFVYLGNSGGQHNTSCPGCGRVLVRREGYGVQCKTGVNCPGCGRKIPLIMED